MEFDATGALEQVLASLSPALDIVAERVDDAHVPAWCARRGWADFLLGLQPRELERCEAHGLAEVVGSFMGAPNSLLELATQVRALSALPTLCALPVRREDEDYRGVSRRKREQLSTLLGALTPLAAYAQRIVDVGAGNGHLTRLAAHHFGRTTLGLERNPERVKTATERGARAGKEALFSARFVTIDAGREPLQLRPDDLAIGLHACGELGDALVTAVADSGADLALVSCCLQKISVAVRSPLSRAARGLELQRETLGLSNLTSQPLGVETQIELTMRARLARYALRRLLAQRGLEVPPGTEMRGINRRRAHAGLPEIARRALEQRGLAPASAAELAHCEHEAASHFEVVRRLSLPRNMLARALELAVVLDRAARLAECGYAVCVASVFDRALTPRNISLFASRDGSRLPRIQAQGAEPVSGYPV